MTPSEIQANRDAAAALIRQQLGLPATPSDWTYDQRNTYNKALAAYIAAHPEQFSDRDLLTADLVSKEAYSALEDDSFQVGTFVTETLKPAGDALQSVGNGVLTTLNMAKWAIPLAGVAALLILFYAANKKAGAPIKLPGAS